MNLGTTAFLAKGVDKQNPNLSYGLNQEFDD